MSVQNGSYYVEGLQNYTPYTSPWYTAGLASAPFNWKISQQYGEFIWQHDGFLSPALERVIAYFLTDIDIIDPTESSLSRDEKEKYYNVLVDNLQIMNFLREALISLYAYGNAFISILPKTMRMYMCRKCGYQGLLRSILGHTDEYKFQFTPDPLTFSGRCPSCHTVGKWDITDKRLTGDDSLRLKLWPPNQIDLSYNDYSEKCLYFFRMQSYYESRIKKGDIHLLSDYPLEMLKAAGKHQLFQFNDDVIFHMKETLPVGIRTNGWGVPKSTVIYDQAYLNALLSKATEVFALEYMIPRRVITPQGVSQDGGGNSFADPVNSMDMSDYKAQIEQMLRNQRRDPAEIQALPFPVQYMLLGGEAKQFMPLDIQQQTKLNYLNSMKIPQGFMTMDLQMQNATPMLRLFESAWSNLPSSVNRLLSWLSERFRMFLNWTSVKLMLKKPHMVDDLNVQNTILSLAQGGSISMSSALKLYGLDYATEERQKIEDAKLSGRLSSKQQAETEAEAQGNQLQNAQPEQPQGGGGEGGAPPQGQPAAGGGQPPAGGGTPMQGGPNVPQMTGDPTQDAQLIENTYGDARRPVSLEIIAQAAQIIAGQLFQNSGTAQRRELLKILDIKGLGAIASSIRKELDLLNSQKPSGQFAQQQ